jgi:hypothetical protein
MIELEPFTGPPRGELIGLRWEDVFLLNPDGETPKVVQQLLRRASVKVTTEGDYFVGLASEIAFLRSIARALTSQGIMTFTASRQLEGHGRCLHAGALSSEERGAEAFGQTGVEG